MERVLYVDETNLFLEEVCAIPGGEKVRLCIQCGACAGSCPTASIMDHTPRQIFAMVRAGQKEEVLSSNAIWFCVSCYKCTVRCPQGIRQTDIMYALKRLSIRYKKYGKNIHEPALSKAFISVVNKYGRNFEPEFLLKFFLKTNPFRLIKYMPFGLKLLSRKRFSLFPGRIKKRKEFKIVIDKALELGEYR